MKNFLIFGSVLVLIVIYVVFFNKDKQPEVADIVSPAYTEMCYKYAKQAPSGYLDRSLLYLSILDDKVTGEFKNIPAEKDSKVGTFSGSVGVMDPKIGGRTADVWWNSKAEGMNVTEQLKIQFGEGSAAAFFGEMVDRGDGTYVYKDTTKLTPGFQMWQVDCKDFLTKTDVAILVPTDITAYEKAMTTYLQDGGKNPLDSWLFVKKIVSVPYTTDIIKASANAAAGEIPTQAKVVVDYFKVQGDTAYVLLNIDLDGWAGVSVSIGTIHPLVEKTLLQFSQIKNVVFGFAPGDKSSK